MSRKALTSTLEPCFDHQGLPTATNIDMIYAISHSVEATSIAEDRHRCVFHLDS